MTMRPIAACVAVLLTVVAPASAQKQMTLLATLTSPTGEPVTTVDATAVNVTENGAALKVASIVPVDRVRKLHVLVDNGVGIPGDSIADLRTGLRGLLAAVPAGVEISIVTTAPQPRMVERGTADREKALKAIDLVAPDTGAGRYVEALYEVSERIERDKNSSNVVVAVASKAGDLRVRDSDLKKVYERAGGGRMKVYTVLFSGRPSQSLGGDMQLTVGEAVAKVSGARFEQVNASSRLATLLPEIGTELGATMGATARQFRILAERSAAGDIGKVSLSVAGLLVSSVNLER